MYEEEDQKVQFDGRCAWARRSDASRTWPASWRVGEPFIKGLPIETISNGRRVGFVDINESSVSWLVNDGLGDAGGDGSNDSGEDNLWFWERRFCFRSSFLEFFSESREFGVGDVVPSVSKDSRRSWFRESFEM
jgi:hypothetical protein